MTSPQGQDQVSADAARRSSQRLNDYVSRALVSGAASAAEHGGPDDPETFHQRLMRLGGARDYAGVLALLRSPAPASIPPPAVSEVREAVASIILDAPKPDRSSTEAQWEAWETALYKADDILALPLPRMEQAFAGSDDADTPLEAAAREAGWALGELVDVAPWEKRQQIADIIARLGLALQAQSPSVESGRVEGAWVQWNGGENPAPGKVVEVRFRDDDTTSDLADTFLWVHEGRSYDIIAYRIIPHSNGEGET